MFYLKYDMYRQNFPLLALATYVNYRNGFITQPGFYQREIIGARCGDSAIGPSRTGTLTVQ